MSPLITNPGSVFLDAFTKAANVPIVYAVKWPDTIASDHPLRKLSLFVRYWPPAVTTFIDKFIDADRDEMAKLPPAAQEKFKATWHNKTYYYVLAATLCDSKGVPAFQDIWTYLYTQEVEQANKVTAYVDVAPRDDNNDLIIPPMDYEKVGQWLKTNFDDTQHIEVMSILWSESMSYNGFKSPDASKN